MAAAGIAVFALKYSLDAVITVKALQNSTHNIQFVPAETPVGPPANDEALNDAIRRNDMEAFQRATQLEDYDQEPLM